MSESTDALLCYGVNIGGAEGDWRIAGVDRYEMWKPSWLTDERPADPEAEDDDYEDDECDEDELIEACRNRLVAAGITYVTIVPHCSTSYTDYILAAHTATAHRGHPVKLAPESLSDPDILIVWDAWLAAAFRALDLQPVDDPAWVLASYAEM